MRRAGFLTNLNFLLKLDSLVISTLQLKTGRLQVVCRLNPSLFSTSCITISIFVPFYDVCTAGERRHFKSPANSSIYEPGNGLHPMSGSWAISGLCSKRLPGQVRLENTDKRMRESTLVAIVSSPENMQQLESIRENSLRLAGLQTDRAGDVNMSAIVWLKCTWQ